MKQTIGALILLLGAGLAGLLALRIWGVAPVDGNTLLRSGATLLVVALAFVALTIVWFVFFKDPRDGYDREPGRRAQPKAGSQPGGLSKLE